jgi:hypothetical protein
MLYFVYQSGIDSCRADIALLNAVETGKEKEKVKTIVEYKEKIKVVYRDKIQEYKKVVDPTGCADVKLIDMGFSVLSKPRQD